MKISVLIPDGESHLLRFIVNCIKQEKDVQIFVLSTKKQSEMLYSRYVYKYIHYEETGNDSDWVNHINHAVNNHNIDVIVPIFETGIERLLNNKNLINPISKLCLLPALSDFEIAGDKGLLYRYLVDKNLPCPKSFILKPGETLNNNLNFPVIIKPVKGFGGGQCIKRIDTPEVLNLFFESNSFDTNYIIQNFINGYDICCNVLCEKGEIFAYTIQKDKPYSDENFLPQIGFEFVEEDVLFSTIKALMKSLNWSGIANIDCRYDFDDKTFKIIEINTRFWVNTEASTLAGVNFPYLLCLLSLNKKIGLKKANLISCLNLKGLVHRIKSNPLFVFKFKYIYNNTPFGFVLKDPLPMCYKYILRTKNIVFNQFFKKKT